MPAPSEALDEARAAAHLVVGPADSLTWSRRRSHLGDGRCVAWTGAPQGVAIDAEIQREVPPALARRHGVEDFWGRWTRLECAAKLSDVPVALLTRDGLDLPEGVIAHVVTVRLVDGRDEVVVSVALSERPRPAG